VELVINGLGKRYRGDRWGLKGFDLTLAPGVAGLLGPNGAGKSTLMRMLATVTKPTEGSIAWNGEDVVRHPDGLRRVIGYLPQDFGTYPNLNPEEFLAYIAAAKGLERKAAARRIDLLLDLVNLADVRRRPLGGFSGGMRQRIGIAQALLNDPKLLIVDEPTAGLDPEERVRFRNLLSDLSGERIILLSTHVVSDVEAVATDLVLIANGRLLRRATPEALLASMDGRVWNHVVSSHELQTFRESHLVSGLIRRADGVHVRVVSERPPGPGSSPLAPSLEDAYLDALRRAGETNG
jgi:ABC-type multidrug transport system ATPase subunit